MSGPLTRRLLLEAAEETRDAGGGVARAWRAVGRCWAELRPVGGGERMSAGAEISRATLRATVPWTPPGATDRPEPHKRFRDGDRVFEILAVSDADPWRRRLKCWLAEGRGE